MNKTLPVSKLKPGMIPAKSIVRPDGAVLTPAGTPLDAQRIDAVKEAGIPSAVVETPAPDASAPLDPMLLEAARDHLTKRFRFADLSHPAVSKLFELCVPRTAAKMHRFKTAFLEEVERPAPGKAFPSPGRTDCIPAPEELLESDLKMVSLPDVFVRINEVVNNPRSSSDEAANVIGMDTSLTAKLLKLVNSAFYGLPSKVDSLSRAVTIVGGRQLTTLALGVSVLSLFKDLPPGLINVRSLWKHSVGCGLIASTLAERRGEPDAERFFVAGLLHDMGRLVMYKNLPGPASRMLLTAREEGVLLRDAERRILGWDHALLAGMLLTKWNFPPSLEDAVRDHHEPGGDSADIGPAVIHAADAAANALGVGSSGEYFVPPLDPAAWNALDIAPRVLEEAVDRADQQVEGVIKAFLPDDPDA